MQHLKYYIDSQCRPGFSLSLGSSHCIGGSRVVLRVPVNPPPLALALALVCCYMLHINYLTDTFNKYKIWLKTNISSFLDLAVYPCLRHSMPFVGVVLSKRGRAKNYGYNSEPSGSAPEML